MSKFFKNNKNIGSADRREIAEFSFAIFRKFELLRFFNENITEHFGRFFVLTYLLIEEKFSFEKIFDIFSSRPYGPSKITDFEKRFIESIDVNKKLPEHVVLNYPEWMTPYIKNAFANNQDVITAEMLALSEKACVDLRVNTLKTNKKSVLKILRDSGFNVDETKLSKNGLRIIDARIGRNHEVLNTGLAEIQDEGSQIVAEICNAKAGDTVVDFCAGAGGKTLAIAADMQNKGRIYALDIYEKRLENAKIRFRRANVNNVFCQEITNKWLKRHPACADIVLVDAPCSGTGTWRRNPDMRAKFTIKDLNEVIALQYEILENAAKLVKSNGKLIYATCSILNEENEMQIKKFIEQYPDFQLEDVKLSKYNAKYLKLSPYKHGTDGFFAAILKKK